MRFFSSLCITLALTSGLALQPSPHAKKHTFQPFGSQLGKAMATGVASATFAVALLNPMPAHASLEEAAVKVADTSYPIISKLQKKAVVPVLSKAINAALSGDPVSVLKIAKAADEALISTDPAKLVAALKVVDVALDDALKSGGVIPPLKDVEEVAKAASSALATTDKAKVKEVFNALIAASTSADKFQVLAVTADGAKLASTINPADAAAVSAAVLDLLKESGAQ